MSQIKSLKYIISFELVGLLFSAVFAFLVVLPFIYYNIDFPLLTKNIILVFIATLFIRWQFFIKNSFFSKSMLWHGVLFFLSLYSIIYFISVFGEFKLFFEEVNLPELMPDLSYIETIRLRDYMKFEFMFFSVLAMISSFFFCFKLVRSVWALIKANKKDNFSSY